MNPPAKPTLMQLLRATEAIVGQVEMAQPTRREQWTRHCREHPEAMRRALVKTAQAHPAVRRRRNPAAYLFAAFLQEKEILARTGKEGA